MTQLRGNPAIGFETKYWNGIEFYKEREYQKRVSATNDTIQQTAQLIFDEKDKQVEQFPVIILKSRTMINKSEITSVDYVVEKIQEDCAIASNEAQHQAEILSRKMNQIKVLGYVPLLGTIVGIIKLVAVKQNAPLLQAYRFSHLARGVVETMSLGFLLFIPDLIVTLHHRRIRA